jgi:hypothetical protein
MVSVATAFSQKVYFVYIQSDPAQSFSLKLNERIYQSSSTGYLILSKLVDSTYPISIIFPQNKWPNQSFKVEVKSKDRGFLLKNFGEKGWGLYDLQTLSIQMNTAEISDKPKAEVQQVSAFTEVLSKAANDPSLKEKPVKKEEVITPQAAVVREEKKTEPVTVQPAVVKEEAKPIAITPPVESIKKEEPSVVKETVPEKKEALIEEVREPKKEEALAEKKPEPVEQEYKPSRVKKKSESSTTEGLGLTFIDEYPDGKKDTIRITIPNPKYAAVTTSKEEPKQDKRFLDIKSDDKAADTAPVNETVKQPAQEQAKETAKETPKEAVKEASKRSACSSLATESDFVKLRRKMVAKSNDDDMVDEAVKYFKTKCFTVEQIKNLNTLFLNDSGKYKFFDAAYAHVSDPDNFVSLQAELKDDYYINRFKAMVR